MQTTLLTLYIIALVGGGSVGAETVASQIQQQLPAQVQQALSSNGITDATVTNAFVRCSSTGVDQYTCNATYDVTSPSQNLNSQQFMQTLTAKIDASRTMTWHAAGSATPT